MELHTYFSQDLEKLKNEIGDPVGDEGVAGWLLPNQGNLANELQCIQVAAESHI